VESGQGTPFPQRAGHYSDESPPVKPNSNYFGLFSGPGETAVWQPGRLAKKPLFLQKKRLFRIDHKLIKLPDSQPTAVNIQSEAKLRMFFE
jgi:hypothetical protein